MDDAKSKALGDKIAELDATNDALVDAFEDMLEHRPPAEAPGVEIDALKAIDPAFDDQAFLAVARESFLQLAEAWEHRDPSLADGLLNAELMEQLRDKIRVDIKAERHHLLPGVEVHTAVITSASVTDGIMTAVVRMHIIGREYFADAAGNIVTGDDTYRQWDEDWTFQRDPKHDTTSEDRTHALLPVERGGWDFRHWGWDAVAIVRVDAAQLS